MQSAFIADQMKIQFGVTSYQLNQAMAIHKILDSKEFEKIIQEFPQNEDTMMRIQEHLNEFSEIDAPQGGSM